MRVQCTCFSCGRNFFRFRSNLKDGARTYCTKECRYSESPSIGSIATDDGLAVKIPLRDRAGNIRAYTVVDADRADWVSQWRWRIHSTGYAVRQPDHRSNTVIYLHRALLGLTPEDLVDVDHRDRDRLNNRLGNIRALPKGGNTHNIPAHKGSTSTHRGVCWNKRRSKWQATGTINGRGVSLGYFDSETEAAEAAKRFRMKRLAYAVD